jgi:hypothetical protein
MNWTPARAGVTTYSAPPWMMAENRFRRPAS